jgi:hypothetical protein
VAFPTEKRIAASPVDIPLSSAATTRSRKSRLYGLPIDPSGQYPGIESVFPAFVNHLTTLFSGKML